MRRAAHSQDTIGWKHLLEGKVSAASWLEITCDDKYAHLPTTYVVPTETGNSVDDEPSDANPSSAHEAHEDAADTNAATEAESEAAPAAKRPRMEPSKPPPADTALNTTATKEGVTSSGGKKGLEHQRQCPETKSVTASRRQQRRGTGSGSSHHTPR